MIILDLACGGSSSYESSSSLVNMAHQRLETSTPSSSPAASTATGSSEFFQLGTKEGDVATSKKTGVTTTSLTIPGIQGFVDDLMKWRKLGGVENLSEPLSRYYETSLQKCMLSVTRPTDATKLKAVAMCAQELEKALRKADSSFEEFRLQQQRYSELGDDGTEGIKPIIRIAMRYLIVACQKHLPAEGITAFLLRWVVGYTLDFSNQMCITIM